MHDSPTAETRSELVLLIDVSRSMQVRDCDGRPRADVAIAVANGINQRSTGTALGVVAYGTTAAIAVPIQTAPIELRELPDVGESSLAVVGLEDAIDLFDRDAGTDRRVVILTDGEDHGPSLASVASRLLDLDISASVVLVGTTEGGFVPAEDSVSILQYEGQPVHSAVQAEPFRMAPFDVVATIATARPAAVQTAVQRLALPQLAAAETGLPLFPYIIAASLLAAVVPIVYRGVFLLPALLLLGQTPIASEPTADELIAASPRSLLRAGNAAADQGRLELAAARFAAAAKSDRFADIALFNLGCVQAQSARRSGDIATYESAINAFRHALKRRPDWPEARQNLQLTYRMMKQARPRSPDQGRDPESTARSRSDENRPDADRGGNDADTRSGAEGTAESTDDDDDPNATRDGEATSSPSSPAASSSDGGNGQSQMVGRGLKPW